VAKLVNRGSTSIRIAVSVVAAFALVLGIGAGVTSASSVLPAQVVKGQLRLEAALRGTLHTQTLCGQAPGLVCTSVVVPLDRTGAVPGSITLHVEELPASGTPRGVMFLIAGGPGQGSAHTFGLGDPNSDALYSYLFPGYTLVAYDDRGTGSSGLLDCPPLQSANDVPTEQTAAAQCGASLGASAAFYSTADHAADLDAVRAALGFGKVGLFGVSYGTKLAMAYALGYPQNVDRLLLDSVLPPELPDPWESLTLQQMTSKLVEMCAGGVCNGPRLASDVVAVANKLGAKAVTGNVLTSTGKLVKQKVDGIEVLSVVLDSDLSPGEEAELPGVMHAARGGNLQPLFRLAYLHDAGNMESSEDLSSALYAATVCRDGPFPWSPDTPVAQRESILQQAIATAPAGTFGPFGSWASDFGNASFCVGWPTETGNAPLGAGPLPDVPMLAVSGSIDMRTPTAGAQSVVARFPQGKLTIVPGVGHSTVTADPYGCAVNAVRTWIDGSAPPAVCPRQAPIVLPVTTIPAPGPLHPKKAASAAATYAVVKQTITEAKGTWLMVAGASGTAAQVGGIYGGKMLDGASTIRFVKYADSHGVTLTGTITFKRFGPPLVFQGTITVGGPGAAHGILTMNGSTLAGALGGRPVG
jgi:pimeloyl-ACP methyl ester carboxylesterase